MEGEAFIIIEKGKYTFVLDLLNLSIQEQLYPKFVFAVIKAI